MKMRLQSSLEKYPISDWSASILKRKEKMMRSMSEMPYWTLSAFNWNVSECSSANFNVARRLRGRPLMRWHGGAN